MSSRILFFVGSIPDRANNPVNPEDELEDRPIFRAARQLGEWAARRGHTIVASSRSWTTIDFHVMQGVFKFVNEHRNDLPNPIKVQIHKTDAKGSPYLDEEEKYKNIIVF